MELWRFKDLVPTVFNIRAADKQNVKDKKGSVEFTQRAARI